MNGRMLKFALSVSICSLLLQLQNIVEHVQIDESCYNGKKKVNSTDFNSMSEEAIVFAILSLKTKNCEGYDRMVQRILTDGMGILIRPFTILFCKIHDNLLLDAFFYLLTVYLIVYGIVKEEREGE